MEETMGNFWTWMNILLMEHNLKWSAKNSTQMISDMNGKGIKLWSK
jgi:hypothetical protein